MECYIRKWKLEDAKDLADILNEKSIHENLRDGLPYPYLQEHAKDYIEAMMNVDEDEVYSFAIVLDDEVIGSISVNRNSNIHHRSGEMGYYIAKPYWDQGLATSAVAQICQYIFEYTDLIRIYAQPFSENIGSCRVLEKNGFIEEGTLRHHAIKNGRVMDMKMYALLKEDI